MFLGNYISRKKVCCAPSLKCCSLLHPYIVHRRSRERLQENSISDVMKRENNENTNTPVARLVSVADFEREAWKLLPKTALDYYRSGAGDEYTLRRNKEAFCSVTLLPRYLIDVSQRSLKCQVLGKEVNMPIGISPTAMQRMAHPEGECANARAAGIAGTIFMLSTLSTSSLEEVASAAPNTTKWFQLYIYKDRNVTKELVRRAVAAGYEALVLTIDAPMFGIRRADERNLFSLPPHLQLANFKGLTRSDVTSEKGKSGLNEYVVGLFDQSLTWADLAWLRKLSPLPLVLKGVLTPEDAVLAAQHGAAAVMVSNHGARQIDTVPTSIEALPGIVNALKGRSCEIYLDGGVSSGTDVFKALALGAKMVFVGRPALWGLAVNGEAGVTRVLEIMRREFDSTMALTGCTTVAQISREYVTLLQPLSKL